MNIRKRGAYLLADINCYVCCLRTFFLLFSFPFLSLTLRWTGTLCALLHKIFDWFSVFWMRTRLEFIFKISTKLHCHGHSWLKALWKKKNNKNSINSKYIAQECINQLNIHENNRWKFVYGYFANGAEERKRNAIIKMIDKFSFFFCFAMNYYWKSFSVIGKCVCARVFFSL